MWQGQFASFPMDERYLLAAVHYAELNPVQAKMGKQVEATLGRPLKKNKPGSKKGKV